MQRFTNQTVLVTGASSGIGAATAERLASEGASVILWGRREDALTGVLAGLQPAGHRVDVVDVSVEQSVANGFIRLKEDGVKVNGIAHVAGVHALRPVVTESSERLLAMFESNIGSMFRIVRHYLRAGVSTSPAAFVGVSSQAALMGGGAASAYAASKGAVEAAIRSWASELATKRIRCNAVAPGVVETPMTTKFFRLLTPDQQAEIRRRHLLGLGAPSDVAACIAFLLSDDARWITGTILRLDGGYSVG